MQGFLVLVSAYCTGSWDSDTILFLSVWLFLRMNTTDYFIKNGNQEYPVGTYNSDVHNPYGSNNVAFRC